jgi:hypothetical protein
VAGPGGGDVPYDEMTKQRKISDIICSMGWDVDTYEGLLRSAVVCAEEHGHLFSERDSMELLCRLEQAYASSSVWTTPTTDRARAVSLPRTSTNWAMDSVYDVYRVASMVASRDAAFAPGSLLQSPLDEAWWTVTCSRPAAFICDLLSSYIVMEMDSRMGRHIVDSAKSRWVGPKSVKRTAYVGREVDTSADAAEDLLGNVWLSVSLPPAQSTDFAAFMGEIDDDDDDDDHDHDDGSQW